MQMEKKGGSGMSVTEIMEKERWAVEEGIVRGNSHAFDEAGAFDPNGVFRIHPFPDINGLEGFKQFFMRTSRLVTDIRWKWDEVVIEGNTAVQRFTVRGKHTGTGSMFAVPPTGKEIVLEGFIFYHVKNGKVIEFIKFSNYLGFFQQLGVIPAIDMSKGGV
jgi:predicted ester cyclase